jgi:superfamily II DNA/RNA helicase
MPVDEQGQSDSQSSRPMDREFQDEMSAGSRSNEEGDRVPEITTAGVADYPDVSDAQPTKPGSHQTMFVSATFTPEIETLARQYMRSDTIKLIAPGADEKPTVDKVEQYYFSVQPWDKYKLLRKLLQREQPELAIVFCRTKHGAEKLAKRLGQDGIECREIHGNLNQNKRDRVMKNFRQSKFDVLVATDLASRGIDVQGISHIINYDIPEDPEIYIHRIGRTARMGQGGKAFMFVAKDQGEELTKVENLINMLIPVATLEGFEPTPPPSDWEDRSGMTPSTAAPIQSRFATPTTTTTSETGEVKTVPSARPLTIGSKIPRLRRHKRR